jgi:hypothetical protein
MSVTVAKLKQPEGELEPSLFPAGDIDTRLVAYIADGVTRAADLSGDAKDAAVTAWAYYRAYAAVVQSLSITPSERSFDSGKSRYKYSPEQVSEFKQSRDSWLDVFNQMTGRGATGSSVAVGQMKAPLLPCPLCRCRHAFGACVTRHG